MVRPEWADSVPIPPRLQNAPCTFYNQNLAQIVTRRHEQFVIYSHFFSTEAIKKEVSGGKPISERG